MALSKDIKAYPESFLILAQRLELEPSVTLTLSSRKVAENVRFQFYGFRKAVKNAGMDEMYPHLSGVTVSIKDTTISFVRAEATAFAHELSAQLAGFTAPETTADQSEPAAPAPSQDDVLAGFLSKE